MSYHQQHASAGSSTNERGGTSPTSNDHASHEFSNDNANGQSPIRKPTETTTISPNSSGSTSKNKRSNDHKKANGAGTGNEMSNGERLAAKHLSMDELQLGFTGLAVAGNSDTQSAYHAALQREHERLQWQRQWAAEVQAAAISAEVAQWRELRMKEESIFAGIISSALRLSATKAQRSYLTNKYGGMPGKSTSLGLIGSDELRDPDSPNTSIGLSPVQLFSKPLEKIQAMEDLALGMQALHLFESERPSAGNRQMRLEIAQRVEEVLLRKWPRARINVEVFGSAITEINSTESDVDLVLIDHTRPYGAGTPLDFVQIDPYDDYGLPILDKQNFQRHEEYPEYYDVRKVAGALRASGSFLQVHHVFAAVSIVKFTDKETGIEVDININERFGLINSQMIKAYADLRPALVRPMIYFVKKWASRRQLNDPAGKNGPNSFSSYTIALMVISHLQHLGLLPNLQDPDIIDAIKLPHLFHWRAKNKLRYNRSGKLKLNDQQRAYDATWYDPFKERANLKRVFNEISAFAHRATEMEKNVGVPSVDPSTRCQQSIDLGSCIRSFFSRMEKWSEVQGMSIARPKGLLPLVPRPLDPEHPISRPFGLGKIMNEAKREIAPIPHQMRYHGAGSYVGAEEGRIKAATHHDRLSNDMILADLYAGGCNPGDLRVGDVLTLNNFHLPDKWAKSDVFVVQDPFIIDRNTSQNIGKDVLERWKKELVRANACLKAGELNCTIPNIALLLSSSRVEELRPDEEEAQGKARLLADWKKLQERDNSIIMHGGVNLERD
ncbi:hypothetical protein K437DRAFT_294845 [Tilletiaria anomala UBC 951]|uniref:Poly(A) RNA polymerase mitochondrial-like central palm domain-containing protein n=1 Tax=Tilletiaria anomala (strain ATCC 24038 / CBS 436.72 / UBC 951) TaxID=1037660 RepID=A0A066W158_TILAU|nr:uncharacterized protein K437DRAFT_294845 [Tilletiaria anomala UBC 951]KDN44525.1 hypothetical protein K437DRAFT_294845 [Tilletiaria anomala UBC 951]